MEKLKTLDYLRYKCTALKNQGKIIVTTNGAFDIIHKGHIYLLTEAKKKGNILIVGLNSDKSIKKYKSITRPINCQEDRAIVLSALECVDYITIFDEPDPLNFLRAIEPHLHVKSRKGYKGLEKEVIDENKIHLIRDVPGYSSTMLLKKLYEDRIYSDTYRRGQSEVEL